MTENDIARVIVDVAYKMHTTLGPGLLESVYEAVMAQELQKRGLSVVRQIGIPIVWDSLHLDEGFRADMIVMDKVIIELKSIEAIAPVHKKQLLTYLRLADKRLGLLINFNVDLIKDGITRIVNGLKEYPTLRALLFAPLRLCEKLLEQQPCQPIATLAGV
jgi:GxxExxY protein